MSFILSKLSGPSSPGLRRRKGCSSICVLIVPMILFRGTKNYPHQGASATLEEVRELAIRSLGLDSAFNL
jgi:hypothetical protein